MPVIGITGGIASGKSTVTRRLAERLALSPVVFAIQVFSADDCAHRLLENDQQVQAEIVEKFGATIVGKTGGIDRQALRDIIFQNTLQRQLLEAILHPRIRECWIPQTRNFHGLNEYFVAEIPLLYETDSAGYFDCICAIEADAAIQVERLSSKRGWSLETARLVIEAQLPAAEKRKRADLLILNYHTEQLLDLQIDLAAASLLLRYA